ncbi:alpha-ketoacid dehydrogenase subunit beta [Xenorhabdus bovienii]|uniref:alpha-ketoacid dehydrogenase subunit beta n=1 Tax=Xenorhabdus bovienii TaxID=40576 RepID=UPI00237CDD37|nr:alpha-ketoacid dehydrogenase subunit beta [Xenorhabdus bovienii]MDE1482048.1 alpha-ketoacid dehydrogenase subunit beta [Xenorhabdus bovienii]MDE9441121.1 alpha-ketoacid dehydrogenase subunit beta [Xenorhabdus bovienii]MDE9546571.1 alpha-ketoacid dehydrogenase subunit beta [Xenorhabdus bovienii]
MNILSENTISLTFAEALNNALDCSLFSNPKVVLLGEDIGFPSGGIYKVTNGLEERYGSQRVRTTPIAEQGIIGLGIGLALAGYCPVVELMLMDYLTIASDQLVNHAAKLRYTTNGASHVPLTVRMHVGGGTMGGAQHSQSLEAWLTHVPGLNVVMPSTPEDAKGLLMSCIKNPDPCVMLECIELLWSKERSPVLVDEYCIPLGKARIRRKGTDLTLVSYGRSVAWSLEAASCVQKNYDISCEVIDLRTLSPVDIPLVLESVKKTQRAVIVHAANKFGGLGAEIACLITEELHSILAHPVIRVGAQRSPVPYSRHLEGLYSPDSEIIIKQIKNIFNIRDDK